MRKLAARLRWMGIWLLPLVGALDAYGAAARPARKLVNVADTRALSSGLTHWIADVYNTSYWAFALLVVSIMAVMGAVLGFAFDRVVARLGVDLGRIEHHE